MSDSDLFIKYLDAASDTVRGWPIWKQTVLGGLSTHPHPERNTMSDNLPAWAEAALDDIDQRILIGLGKNSVRHILLTHYRESLEQGGGRAETSIRQRLSQVESMQFQEQRNGNRHLEYGWECRAAGLKEALAYITYPHQEPTP